MKRIITIALLAISFSFCKAQYVTIPDVNFVNWLNANGYSSCMNGNQMDTTCSAILSASFVDCSDANINDITGIQYFKGLLRLKCMNNNLTFLPALPQTLTFFRCDSNQLSTLPSLPGSIDTLTCDSNLLTSIDSLPNALVYFDCSQNLLSALPTLPYNMQWLLCYSNQLTALPALPDTLYRLYCYSNLLTALPKLPSNLWLLFCDENQISALPGLPSNLGGLSCDYNQLTSLPALPSSLFSLSCDGNSIGALPTLPDTMLYIECEFCNLDTLPSILPVNLNILDVNYNNLDSIPALPPTLTTLYCTSNQLTVIPVLPPNLTQLSADYNQLTTLPALPDSLNYLSVEYNTNLTCLPQLNIIYSFYFENTGITCLPDYGKIYYSDPPISSYPLCNSFNSNTCSALWSISGKVFSNDSTNCQTDTTGTGLPNLPLLLYQNGNLVQQSYTSAGGLYSLNTTLGTYTYTVDTAGLPLEVGCPQSGYDTSILTAIDSFSSNNNFSLHCKPGFDLAVWSISGNSFRPGTGQTISISAGDYAENFGLGCADSISGTVQLVFSGPVTFTGMAIGALTPTKVSGDTLTWDIGSFDTISYNQAFNILLSANTSANVNDEVCVTVTITPTTGTDINPANNTLTNCFSIVNSLDPNNKQVYPTNSITAGEWLTYTIHFQNTGTADAQNIQVLDTLDPNLDASTFQLLSYSTMPQVHITGNVVLFSFTSIDLPDSSSTPSGSIGFVQYRVKTSSSLPINTNVQNTASVYFDYNAPVQTNTVSTIYGTAGIKQSIPNNVQLSVYPNPANNLLNINSNISIKEIEIMDVLGRTIYISPSAVSAFTKETIDLSNYPAGIYFVKVIGDNLDTVKKVVKE